MTQCCHYFLNRNRNNNNNLNNRNTSSSNSGRTTPATPKDVSKEVSEALIEAVRRQDLSELDNLILRSGVDGNNINCLGREGDSPLHRSCRLGALETVKLLVMKPHLSFMSCLDPTGN